jgi:hypothetical protein
MTDKTITTYYKWLSLATLIVSVIGSMTLVDGTVIKKLGIGLLINLQFHLAFQFLSRVPFAMYTLLENDKTWKRRLVPKILKVFSFFIMFGAVIALVGMLKSVILNHQYDQLIVTMTFLAMFLGGLSLNFKLRQI